MAKNHASALLELSHRLPSGSEFEGAFAGLRGHSVRGAALIAAAQLDLAMMAALGSKLRSLDRNEHAHLFGPDGPYGTTNAKIHVLYSLGVIGIKTKKRIAVTATYPQRFCLRDGAR